MENAAKALQIAGGVLLSIMILGIIVFSYNNWKKLGQSEYQSDVEEQAVDFNKQFEIYNKNGVYGTELLSLANKIVNYNDKESNEKGYSEIQVTVEITIPIIDFSAGTKNIVELYQIYDQITKEMTLLGKMSKKSTVDSDYKDKTYTISQWSRIAKNKIPSDVKDQVDQYKKYLDTQTDFARKTFRCTSVQYGNNGRITSMSFRET